MNTLLKMIALYATDDLLQIQTDINTHTYHVIWLTSKGKFSQNNIFYRNTVFHTFEGTATPLEGPVSKERKARIRLLPESNGELLQSSIMWKNSNLLWQHSCLMCHRCWDFGKKRGRGKERMCLKTRPYWRCVYILHPKNNDLLLSIQHIFKMYNKNIVFS